MDIMNAFHDVTEKLFSKMYRFTLSDDSFDKLKREIDDYLRGMVPEKNQ